MISEQQAREAAERIKNGGGDAFACWEDYQESSQKDDDVEIASAWIVQELARREAERAERAKPIDAEWLESIGACDGGAWRYVQYDGGKVYIGRSMDVWVNASSVSAIRTRGQLLDLLAALKGNPA